MVRAALVLIALTGVAHADRDLCAPGTPHHGAPIDLDLKDAHVTDVLRLLADVGHVNLVVGGDVQGKVTMRLVRAPWDAALCTVAAVTHLTVTLRENIVTVSSSR